MPSERYAVGESVLHGAYAEIAAVELIRHSYAATDAEDLRHGYLEVLEFPDPPNGRPVAVIYEYLGRESTVISFSSLPEALAATEHVWWHDRRTWDAMRAAPGYLGLDNDVWFYELPPTL